MNPYTTLLVNVLPIFAEDAHEMVVRIMDHAKDRGEEIDMNDGFDLYKQLTSTRRYFSETLPEYDLAILLLLITMLTIRAVLPSHSM